MHQKYVKKQPLRSPAQVVIKKKNQQTTESCSWHLGGCFAYSCNTWTATSWERNCSISSWVIIADAGAAAAASAGTGLLQFRFEKGLNQPKEKAPPNASFIPSQPLIFSQVGFWFLRRSIPCKKRRVLGHLTFTAGICAPTAVARAKLHVYNQDVIQVLVNNEDGRPALLKLSSLNLTTKP